VWTPLGWFPSIQAKMKSADLLLIVPIIQVRPLKEMFKNCQEQNRIQPILNIWQLIKFFLKSKKYFVSFRQYKYHASLLYWKLSDSNISFLQCLPIRRMFIEFSSCISMNFIRIRRRDNCCHKFCISSKVFPPILFGWCFALSTHWHQLFSEI